MIKPINGIIAINPKIIPITDEITNEITKNAIIFKILIFKTHNTNYYIFG